MDLFKYFGGSFAETGWDDTFTKPWHILRYAYRHKQYKLSLSINRLASCSIVEAANLNVSISWQLPQLDGFHKLQILSVKQ